MPKYGWTVHTYIAVHQYYTHEILDKMRELGADQHLLSRAYGNLVSGNLNTGLTYSNPERHESVVVVALTSSPEEFANSLVHEMSHLRRHIENACDIDPDSEEPCYLMGELVQSMYAKAYELLCPHCRKPKYRTLY